MNEPTNEPPGDEAASAVATGGQAETAVGAPGSPGSSRFTRFHAQTYEMELLVSGALAFALLQVPARLDARFERALTYVDGDLRLLVVYGFVYVSLAVTALIVFFAANLLLRAFWIGLVGLESVYPGGIDWERLKVGRHTKELLQRKMPTLSASIERLDDICSLVFSLAFSIVLTFVYSIGVVVVCLGLAWLAALLGPWPLEQNFWMLFVVVLGLVSGIALLDKHLGPKLTPGRGADRLLARAVTLSVFLSPLRLVGPIALVLQSRLSQKRANFLIVGSIVGLSAVFMGSMFVREGLLGVGSLVYMPEDAGGEGVSAKSYRSSWNSDDFDVASWRPSIDTDVVVGPYLRLFLPYRPGTHNGRIVAACPDLEQLRVGGVSFGRNNGPAPAATTRQSLECFVGVFRVSLDGVALEGLRWDWYTEPQHAVPGAIAYLDVRELAPGRHVLEIDAPRGRPPAGPDDNDQRRLMVIPFWR